VTRSCTKEEILAAARRQGCSEEQIQCMMNVIPKLIQEGLLKRVGEGVRTTAKGRKFCKSLIAKDVY
jgi:predicted methyltransferase